MSDDMEQKMQSIYDHTLSEAQPMNKLAVGDWIRLQGRFELRDFKVCEFRQCLGIWESGADIEAGRFTPLCEMYEAGPDSEKKYISNYGTYQTNMIPSWMNIPPKEPPHE